MSAYLLKDEEIGLLALHAKKTNTSLIKIPTDVLAKELFSRNLVSVQECYPDGCTSSAVTEGSYTFDKKRMATLYKYHSAQQDFDKKIHGMWKCYNYQACEDKYYPTSWTYTHVVQPMLDTGATMNTDGCWSGCFEFNLDTIIDNELAAAKQRAIDDEIAKELEDIRTNPEKHGYSIYNEDFMSELPQESVIAYKYSKADRTLTVVSSKRMVFKSGDTIRTGSYNLIYLGKIVKVTPKCVFINEDCNSYNTSRLSFDEFINLNADLDLDAIHKQNAKTMYSL